MENIVKILQDSAFRVRTNLGPGLLESFYEVALAYEITKTGVSVKRQNTLPVKYQNVILISGLRLDLFVEGKVIVGQKRMEVFISIFEAQLLTYLKLTTGRLGFFLNFNVLRMKHGLKKMSFDLRDSLCTSW